MKPAVRREDLLYPDLSYAILGAAFDVQNGIGSGHNELYYQRALREAFKERGIRFREQAYSPVRYSDKIIGKQFLDFIVEGKVVVEIKKRNAFSKKHIEQVLEYLKASTLKLALIINFGESGVKCKRIVNIR